MRIFYLLLLTLLPITSVQADARLQLQRQQFKQAYELINSGKDYNFVTLSKGLQDYPLYAYLQFSHLYTKFNKQDEAAIRRFLQENANTPLEKRMRTRWLYKLAKQKNWQAFLSDYQPQSASDLRCYQLQARINTTPLDQTLLNDIRAMWLVGQSQVKECDPAFERFYKSKLMSPELIWERIRLSMQAGNLRLAKHLSARLNKDDQQRALLWRQVVINPQKNLNDPALGQDTPLNREIVMHGLHKLASNNPMAAKSYWINLKSQYAFTQAEQESVERQITFTAVQKKLPQAPVWLESLQSQQNSDEIQRYLIRYATGAQDWERLEKWTRKSAHPDFNHLRWKYWKARSLEHIGQKSDADLIYKALAHHRDYYGFLAAEKLGVGYRYNDQRLTLNREQEAALLAIPAIMRARELYVQKIYEDARREWSHATSTMKRDQLLQSSVLADEWGWHDRTILTLGQAKAYDDLERRFPLPYNTIIKKYASKRGLPASIIYTLMRSESAFIHDVRSWAGAMGLMQVMPATGQQTAKKIGLKNYKNASQLYDPETNIAIGTAYLKEMLKRYDGNFIMAAAAYNAGPHRVTRWRPERGCKPGEEWVETIPFNETRRYVRRALFYSVLYQWRMNEKINSIQSQLKAVPAVDVSCN